MRAPDPIVIDAVFRNHVDRLTQRLATDRAVVATGWEAFAGWLDLTALTATAATAVIDDAIVVVGPPAFVLRHASRSSGEFGFVTPVAQLAKWWQRESTWRDEITLDLWKAGWSPADVDRVMVATHEVRIEFAIGNVRPTPAIKRISGEASAFDDPD